MSANIDINSVILAVIPTIGVIAAAYITARNQTKDVRKSSEAKPQAVQRAIDRGDLSSDVQPAANQYAFKVSTKMLFVRSILALMLAFGSIFLGMFISSSFDTSADYMAIPFLIFCLMAAYFLFRLLYRFFWLAFIR
ncbi:MAG: hypothetical protein ABJO86_14715 [Lentilitoribacter sp.]